MLKQLQYTLQDSFEKNGLWWLPNEPDNEVGGVLSYNPGVRPRLELTGTFRPDWSNNDRFEPEIIQGVTSDGIECTLCNNLASESMSVPGFVRQDFDLQYLLMGHHFNTLDEIQFISYEENFQYLEDWLFQRPYVLDVEHGEGKFEYNIHWPARTLLKAELTEIGGTISLYTDLYSIESSATALHVRSNAYLKWEPESPQGFDQFKKLFFDVQRFFTLLFGENTFPRRIRGFVKEEKGRAWPIAIYYNLPVTPSPTTLYRHDMLIPYQTVSDQLASLLDNWLLNADKLRPVYDLFFGSLSKPDMFLENRFLNLVHAIESYHRVMKGGQYLPAEEYNKYYEALVEQVSKIIPSSSNDLRSALRARLEWGNDFSQRHRLKKILEELGDELRALVTTQNVNRFVKKIVDTRNQLVHQGKTQIMGNQEMFYACQRLRVLLTILLLQTLGLDSTHIKETITSNRRIQPWDNKDSIA